MGHLFYPTQPEKCIEHAQTSEEFINYENMPKIADLGFVYLEVITSWRCYDVFRKFFLSYDQRLNLGTANWNGLKKIVSFS